MFSKDYSPSYPLQGDTEGPAPQIHEKLQKIRELVGTLEAEKKAGVPFKVKSSEALGLKLRAALDATGCNARLVRVVAKALPTLPAIPPTEDFDGEDAVFCAQATVTVRITAPDGSFADFEGFGMGTASDDKAAGKAVTYATKCAYVYGLNLPGAAMPDADDEVRKRKAAPAKPAGSPKLVAAMTSAIKVCESREALTALRADILKMPKEDQAALTKPYGDRWNELATKPADAPTPEL